MGTDGKVERSTARKEAQSPVGRASGLEGLWEARWRAISPEMRTRPSRAPARFPPAEGQVVGLQRPRDVGGAALRLGLQTELAAGGIDVVALFAAERE